MSEPFTHRDIEELLGAYALDALDSDERDAVDAHLAGCPRCRAEVATHRETAALLAQGGEHAPEGVWARIAVHLEESPPHFELVSGVPPRPRRSISVRTAALLGAAAAAVFAFLGTQIVRQEQRLDALNEQLTEMLAADGLRRAALAAVAEPEAEQLWLESSDGQRLVNVIRLPDGTGFVVADRLSALPPDHTYQLWALREDVNISLGVLGRDPGVASFQMAGAVIGYAVTEEESPGVVSSEQPPVVAGFLDPSA